MSWHHSFAVLRAVVGFCGVLERANCAMISALVDPEGEVADCWQIKEPICCDAKADMVIEPSSNSPFIVVQATRKY